MDVLLSDRGRWEVLRLAGRLGRTSNPGGRLSLAPGPGRE
jgi:hypothetical protein